VTTEVKDLPPSKPAAAPRLPKLLAALIGITALAAALAAGQLVAGFVGINASPFIAVANTVIDKSPLGLVKFAEQTLGSNDKLYLKIGMAVVIVLIAAVAGLLSRRKPLIGQIVFAVFGVLGVLAVYNRSDLGQVGVLAPVVCLVVGVLVFNWLFRMLLPESFKASVAPGSSEDPNRRKFLLTSAGVLAGSAVAGVAGQLVGNSKNAEGSRAAVGKLVPARTAPAIPADADFAKLGTPPFITPAADFYRVDTAFVIPQVRTEDWSLKIHGMVDREVTFNYSDIRNRPLVERTVTLTCVSNEVGGPYTSTASFVGVDLADLLNEAGVKAGAEQLFATSVDGWNAGSPIEAVLDPKRGAMLAIGANGDPLPIEHGFPARIVIPGLYGYVSATKWVTDLNVTTWQANQAYWLKRGWSEQGPIKTESRIDSPSGFANVSHGKVRVAGTAWAQHTGIAKVEVRVDQGPWQTATLSAEVNKDTWRMWWTEVDVPTGTHQVFVRATDQSGYTQTSDRAGTVPNGATGWHSVTLTSA
jgi:DMSO/TMAO reductase YedYZ molybdopterin-dependent catalytic subunit